MKLDIDTAHRLSLDAALGQLTPDVRALWEAYLHEDPELARRAELDRRTVELARQALADQTPAGIPEPPAPLPPFRHGRPVFGAAWAAGLAAALIVGVTLGFYLAPRGGAGPAEVAGPTGPGEPTGGYRTVTPAVGTARARGCGPAAGKRGKRLPDQAGKTAAAA